jgi:hypothetical protein
MRKKVKGKMDDTKNGLIEQIKFLKSVVQVLLQDINKMESITNELRRKRN